MKKLFAVCIIGLALGTAGVFADHPDGWGIGPGFGFNWGWPFGGGGGSAPGIYLSLKAPKLPVFWGLSLGFGTNYFGLGVTGDWYIIDKPLAPAAKLHWFLGVGGFLTLNIWGGSWSYAGGSAKWSYLEFGGGVRVPVGLSWQPLDWLEVFGEINASLGIGGSTDSVIEYDVGGEKLKHTYHEGGLWFPVGGLGGAIGVRFWF
ncbi:MAG: hypothetical protein LBG73_07535 [Spirochaetaceae bacterium]|jgi:hypothetical protein|nr:hypothetical protein [Spirochaetaceae bacterium]